MLAYMAFSEMYTKVLQRQKATDERVVVESHEVKKG
jgi:hypothetical protein